MPHKGVFVLGGSLFAKWYNLSYIGELCLQLSKDSGYVNRYFAAADGRGQQQCEISASSNLVDMLGIAVVAYIGCGSELE
jgi:hypothetical protein